LKKISFEKGSMIVTENIRTYEQMNVVILKGFLNAREQK
jgi:hypothetical protein